MAIVASELIKSSLRLIGVLATGETPSAQESADALATFNDLVDSWALENLMLYRNEVNQFTLVPGQYEYTIGAGGDFNITRPVSIEQAFVNYNGLDLMLRPILTTDEYNRIAIKTLAAPIPSALYYQASYPFGECYIWPVPTQALTLSLSTNMQFTPLTDVTQSISYPPGYQKALRYALALELAPEYGVTPSPQVVKTAAETIGSIKAANRQQPVSRFDVALTKGGSVGIAGFLAGEF